MFGRTLIGGMWGAGPAADLGRVFVEPLAEDNAVVDDLNHQGVVPYGFLEEVGQCGSACQGFLRTCLAQWAKSRLTK